MFATSFSFVFLFIILNKSSCEEFNLHGLAGQAYALEIEIGKPPQRLNVLVDTGSTTLAIASYPFMEGELYFNPNISKSIFITHEKVEAKYSQGTWVGEMAIDTVSFPSMPAVRSMSSQLGLIKDSHKFFTHGSGWQGLLGLAYMPVGAWGDNLIVGSWLDSVERGTRQSLSFQLKLCGVKSPTNATHYGKFEVLDNYVTYANPIYRTPVLQKRWYEVGVLAIRVLREKIRNVSKMNKIITSDSDHHKDMCLTLNKEKSIVDSGTTNIRLPETVFREVVDQLRSAAQESNMLILDEFWYHGEAACWPEPQDWSLPLITIDLLSMEADNEYFTLDIPPKNYMRVVTALNNSGEGGTVSEFCYKLGLEAGRAETVLGYTAMEGLEVLFNRSAGWIGWRTSDCGPDARITGPYNSTESFLTMCKLKKTNDTEVTIKAAQWVLCGISIVASAVLIYLLAPCVKVLSKPTNLSSSQISLSEAALVDQENA